MKSLYSLLLLSCMAAVSHAQTAQIVRDINTGNASSQPTAFTTFNNSLYFSADDGRVGRELWGYNGSQAFIVADVKFGTVTGVPLSTGQPSKMAVLGGRLYFAGTDDTSGTAPVYGNELMAYTGLGRPVIAADIIPGSASSTPVGLMAFNNKLYFAARELTSNGNELYSYDGFNTPVMYDINPGSGGSNPLNPFAFQNRIYFSAEVGAGRELYVFNPSTGLTTMVDDINPGASSSSPVSFVAVGSRLYFIATTDTHGTELYSYDGAVVTRITDLAQGINNGVYSGGLAYLNGYIYFSGSTDGSNFQLYQCDVNNNAVSLVKTINTAGSANPFGFTVYNNKVFFAAQSPGFGSELWSTDGFTTAMAVDISTGGGSSSPSSLYVHNGMLYMAAFTSATGAELFRYSEPLGIHNTSFKGSVNAYPVPATGNVTLSMNLEQSQNLSIALTDQLGRTVWTKQEASYPTGKSAITVPMQTLASGAYFYHICNTSGKMLASGKVVRQ